MIFLMYWHGLEFVALQGLMGWHVTAYYENTYVGSAVAECILRARVRLQERLLEEGY